MISVSQVNKTYQGYDIDHKESGVVLWAKNIFKLTSNRARSVHALRDVSFDVQQGQIFGIYGANGAGKTTLVKILSGLLLPESGTVRVNGHDSADRIKDQVSYVSTNGWMGLEWQLTAHENVVLYGNIFALPRAGLHARCDAALDRFGLLDARDKHISELSAGMRQKVTLARGFLLERPILYLDEPSVSLDVPSATALRKMLAQYVHPADGQGPKTVLIASHNPLDLQICDRILMLSQGRAVAVGTMEDLQTPLRGIVALHIACAGRESPDIHERASQELLPLAGVRSVWTDPANGKGQTWRLRLLVQQDAYPTGQIVDWFVRHDLPIVSMQQRDVTLQEIYASHLEAAHVD